MQLMYIIEIKFNSALYDKSKIKFYNTLEVSYQPYNK